jgi:protein KRI1
MALLSGKTRDDDEELVTHVESQYRLKREAVEAFKSFADDEDDEDFAPVKKEGADNDEDEAEDEEYRKFLLEMGGGEAEVRKLLGTDGTESGLGEETRELEVKVKEKGAPGKEKKPSREGKAAIAEEKKSVKAKADGDFLMK